MFSSEGSGGFSGGHRLSSMEALIRAFPSPLSLFSRKLGKSAEKFKKAFLF
jgi:hypothetical protein